MRLTKLKRLWEQSKTDKKTLFCLAAGALGLLLLLLSTGSDEKKDAKETQSWDVLCEQTERSLESRAEKLLSTVAGVGKARVVITLESLEERVYAQNSETDADGGSTRDYVIVSQNSVQTGLSEKIVLPTVRGVAVCCEGGGSPQVRREVSGLLCAALGVPANRIYVTAMKR